ncbi:DNA-binding transcriptional MerR regulator [Nocardiopsis mwathae]|uniref:DNA-binding transcriptional MerR regulator n=1 Tax=Nocardiopsis mwathae TaxID=1472723 RepID=A0A7W9YM46_9ACTN|nr:MerR family transcriptional regulator [Nocardiopsis mwathae]MBB6174669.1 DNA-binding transcriptional MerR regulator [Nocardiopsis mwathae]
MRIGELSHRTGVSVRSLLYYEEQGLLSPLRRPSGYRDYTEADIKVVHRIRTLIAAGLNTELIAQVLHCFRGDSDTPVPTCAEMVTELSAARDTMTTKIDDLQSSRALLESIIEAAPLQESPQPVPA